MNSLIDMLLYFWKKIFFFKLGKIILKSKMLYDTIEEMGIIYIEGRYFIRFQRKIESRWLLRIILRSLPPMYFAKYRSAHFLLHIQDCDTLVWFSSSQNCVVCINTHIKEKAISAPHMLLIYLEAELSKT